jgi:cysteine desulfurase
MYDELLENITLANSAGVYLDHASGTNLRNSASKVLNQLVGTDILADPNRLYLSAVATRDLIEFSRARVGEFFDVAGRQVIFTSSASEAISQAVYDAAIKCQNNGNIIISKTEHSAVKKSAVNFSKIFSHRVIELNVDSLGTVDLDQLSDLLNEIYSKNTSGRNPVALVAIQYANHEIGTKQPIARVSELCSEYRIPLLIDLANSLSNDVIDLSQIDYTYLSLSGPKFGAPVGSGALIIKKNHVITSLINGSSQELRRRAGIENMYAIAGFGAAITELSDNDSLGSEVDRKFKHTLNLTESLASNPDVEFYGSAFERLSNLISFSVNGIQAGALTLQLDQMGVYIHSGSACSNEIDEPSYILEAIGKPEVSPIRVSVGWKTTDEEVRTFLDKFNEAVAILSKYRH